MNQFRYDVQSKNYSFVHLSDDQIMDLTKDEAELYRMQRDAWRFAEGDLYEAFMLMAKVEAVFEHELKACGGNA